MAVDDARRQLLSQIRRLTQANGPGNGRDDAAYTLLGPPPNDPAARSAYEAAADVIAGDLREAGLQGRAGIIGDELRFTDAAGAHDDFSLSEGAVYKMRSYGDLAPDAHVPERVRAFADEATLQRWGQYEPVVDLTVDQRPTPTGIHIPLF